MMTSSDMITMNGTIAGDLSCKFSYSNNLDIGDDSGSDTVTIQAEVI